VPIYAPSWSGFYLGAGIGGTAVVHDVTARDLITGDRLFQFDGGDSGVLGTVILGWDWQLGPKTVLGVFADFDWVDLATRHRVIDGDPFRHSADHDNAWAIGARFGWLTSPSVLWYLTGGYTQLQVDHSARFLDADALTRSRDRWLDGFFVGAGVDTRLAASNWFLRLEYRFSDFDTSRLRLRDEGLGEDIRVNNDIEAHSARLTLTYKFTPGMGWGSMGGAGWGP
jgi:outer membrane immunogenic protein